MKTSLQIKTAQGLTMTQQLQQAIHLLQLSNIELQAEVQEQLESNVMLEIEEDEIEQNNKNINENQEPKVETSLIDNQVENDDSSDIFWDENFENTSINRKTNLENKTSSFQLEEEDSKYKTLQEHLRWQLNLIPMSDIDKVIAEAIIDSLNDDGFLDCSIENILETIENELEETNLEEIEAVLKIIQSLSPTGVGARNLKECLSIQLKQYGMENQKVSKALELVEYHFESLVAHDYKKLTKKLKLDQKELDEVIDFIQTMNPRPGSQINNSHTEYTIPDVTVKKENNNWVVKINNEAVPNLRINSFYKNMIRRADNSTENKTLKSHLQEADWFIKSIQHRNETLLKVSKCIIEHQRDFLEYGDEAMKPLILQDIAQTLGMHESTISRATTRKYMHTPKGTYELKYFFSSHVSTNYGGSRSSTAIRALVKKLINEEQPSSPLSDNKIASLLKEEGINVARRTVAKYREAMKIPSSNERKKFSK